MTTEIAIPDLPSLLRELVRQIPRGTVTTYGRLALALGHVNAARWVGQWLMDHAHDAGCPCHRVVRVDGNIGGFLLGEAIKRRLLEAEGVAVLDGRVALERHVFEAFRTDRPLAGLCAMQDAMASQTRISRRKRFPRQVGGFDVSYPTKGTAVGAYALVDVETGHLLWHTTVRRALLFPYITSFLSFRELPVLFDLLRLAREADRLAEVVLVDGSGMLHPRRAGIASHLGVLGQIASIGVTKKLLCGQIVDESLRPDGGQLIVLEGRPLGVALVPRSGSQKPLFISPGHRVDVDFAAAVVHGLLRGHRLPEPLYWADRLSRAEGRQWLARQSHGRSKPNRREAEARDAEVEPGHQ